MHYHVYHHQNPPGSDSASYWMVYGQHPAVMISHTNLLAIFRDKDQAEAWIDSQEQEEQCAGR